MERFFRSAFKYRRFNWSAGFFSIETFFRFLPSLEEVKILHIRPYDEEKDVPLLVQ